MSHSLWKRDGVARLVGLDQWMPVAMTDFFGGLLVADWPDGVHTEPAVATKALDFTETLEKFNPNHDENGRFATAGGRGGAPVILANPATGPVLRAPGEFRPVLAVLPKAHLEVLAREKVSIIESYDLPPGQFGRYYHQQRIVELSARAPDPTFTLNHELGHAMDHSIGRATPLGRATEFGSDTDEFVRAANADFAAWDAATAVGKQPMSLNYRAAISHIYGPAARREVFADLYAVWYGKTKAVRNGSFDGKELLAAHPRSVEAMQQMIEAHVSKRKKP